MRYSAVTFPTLDWLTFEIEGGPGRPFNWTTFRSLTVFPPTLLVNGDFETGDLTGWEFIDGEGSALVTNGVDLIFVPEYTGDFNGDLKIDAADYVAWRKTDGTPQGYDTWRTRFGETISSGSASGTCGAGAGRAC